MSNMELRGVKILTWWYGFINKYFILLDIVLNEHHPPTKTQIHETSMQP